jgi:hypothetical protein
LEKEDIWNEKVLWDYSSNYNRCFHDHDNICCPGFCPNNKMADGFLLAGLLVYLAE